MQPELVLFDLDGTLVEFHHDYLYSETHRIIDSMGLAAVEQQILEESFAAFDFFRFLHEDTRESFIEQFWDMFNWNGFPEPRAISGALDTLEGLRTRGLKLAIVTSRLVERDALWKDLAGTGVLELADHVDTRSCEKTHWTDKRALIKRGCEVLGVEPAKAIMVGDIPTDIESARDVGIGKTVALLSGGVRQDVLERAKPSLIIPDVSHLHDSLFTD